MRVLGEAFPAALLIFFLFTAPSTADIKSIKIRSDNRPLILFQMFGFTDTGNISVAISNVTVTPTFVSLYDPSLVGFFLLSKESLVPVLLEIQQNASFCIVDSKFITLLFTLRDLPPPPGQSSFHRSHPVTSAGEYSLFFANCNPESHVTMDVRIETFNTDDGATKDYLSAGRTQLPSLYFIFSIIYLCFLGFWISVWFKNQQSLHRVHLLMGVLLITNAINLFCAAEDKLYVKVTGTPHGWNLLFNLFHFINDVVLFTVIVLIGAGLPYLKPFLVGKEKKVLMIVITLRVLANVASMVIAETGPFDKHWVTWNQVFLLADVVCCCVIVFHVAMSIRSFSRTDVKGGRVLSLFRKFRMAVICYLLMTRIGVFALKTTVSYEQQWVCAAADEIASLVFCLVMVYMFRPVEGYDYVVVDDESEYEVAAEMVKG